MEKFFNVNSSAEIVEKTQKYKDCVRIRCNIKKVENGYKYDELVLTYDEYNNFTFEDYRKYYLEELERFIFDIRSNGIEYKDQLWSIDEDCEKNLTSQITLLSFAPVEKVSWFSKTQVNELTIEEFKELALVLSNAIANAKMKYYTYKNAIERAETQEDLETIIFEETDSEV